MSCAAKHPACQRYPGLGNLFGHDRNGHAALAVVVRHLTGALRPGEAVVRSRLKAMTVAEVKDMHGVGPDLAQVIFDARRKA